MTKKFFTKVNPKAAQGIRKAYESEGYQVHAKLGSDGLATVVVIKDDKANALISV